jgi:hypothetical protein
MVPLSLAQIVLFLVILVQFGVGLSGILIHSACMLLVMDEESFLGHKISGLHDELIRSGG